MFPNVDAEQRLAFAGGVRVGAVRRFGHFQLAATVQDQPGPAGAELADAGRLEGILEGLHGFKILDDLGFELTGYLAAGWAHILPEQIVIPMLSGIIEHRRQVRLVV